MDNKYEGGVMFNPELDFTDNPLMESLDYGNSFYSSGIQLNEVQYESAYFDYMQTKINSERALCNALKQYIPVNESMLYLTEAKFGDNAKSKWNKFIEFIKGIVDKFMESMSNLLLDEKAYLEKYKDIILKRTPKDDIEYKYYGDYPEGIKRLIATEIPIFNGTYLEKIKQDIENDNDNTNIVNTIMGGTPFKYDKDISLSEQFKSYFLGDSSNIKTGKLSDPDINMQDMYNFCYNYKNIEKVVDKDKATLERTTNTILKILQDELRKYGVDINAEEKTVKNPGQIPNQESSESTEPGKAGGAGGKDASSKDQEQNQPEAKKVENVDAAAINLTGIPINELEITNTNASSQMGSYTNSDKNEEEAKNKQLSDGDRNAVTKNAKGEGLKSADIENEIQKCSDKWIEVCRAILTAKLTAYQQIAKDYMDMIRAHVRSYGGKDLEKDNESLRKNKLNGTNYGDKTKPQEEQPKET